MALETSILKSVKKSLGLGAENTAFDHDVVTHINTCFFSLHQFGLGPPEGFMIEDDAETWVDFTTVELSVSARNALQTYFYLKVRLLFDPPDKPHHLKAIEEQVRELEHRLLTEREISRWPARSILPGFEQPVVLDGGIG